MIGARVYPNERGALPAMSPGDYGQAADGDWVAVMPDGSFGRLTDHNVIEHEDGTITVEPSIYLDNAWHGYLVRGEWRDA